MIKEMICLVFCLGFVSVYADVRDPFQSYLPAQKEVRVDPPDLSLPVQNSVSPLDVVLEGVLWGIDNPQAIIDGEVYKEGETIRNKDAVLYKIERNKAIIIYYGQPYKIGIGKKLKE